MKWRNYNLFFRLINLMLLITLTFINTNFASDEDNDNISSLMWAAQYGDLAKVKDLLSKNADVNAKNEALITASCNGNLEIVKFLIDDGADVNTQDKSHGDTALKCASFNGRLDIVKTLLESKVINVNVKDNNGTTALISATIYPKIDIVKSLLEHSANPNLKNNDGMTALMSAASISTDDEVVEALLENNAEINAIDNSGKTALMYAAGKGNFSIIKILLSKRADVNIKDANGKTALMHNVLSSNARDGIVQILIDNGSDLDATDNNGETALMYASQMGLSNIHNILIARGADSEIKNKDNLTAFDIGEKTQEFHDIKTVIFKQSMARENQALSGLNNNSGTEREQAVHYQRMGKILCDNGWLEQGKSKFEESIKLLIPLSGAERELATVYQDLSMVLQDLGRYEEALINEQQALRLFTQLSNSRWEQGYCYRNMGKILNHLGRFEEALTKEYEALVLFTSPQVQDEKVASQLKNLNINTRDDKIISQFKTLLINSGFKLNIMPEINKCILDITVAMVNLGMYEDALPLLEAALKQPDLQPWEKVNLYTYAGKILNNLGRNEEAVMLLEEVVKYSNKLSASWRSWAELYATLAEAYLSIGNPGKALSILEPYKEMGKKLWYISGDLAKAYYQRADPGDADKAATQLIRSIECLEKERQTIFAFKNRVTRFEEPSMIFRDFVAMLADWHNKGIQIKEPEIVRWLKDADRKTGLLAAAFHFSEQGRGRVLEAGIREQAVFNRQSAEDKLFSNQRELSLRLSKISTRLIELPDTETELRQSLTSELYKLEESISQLEVEIKKTHLGKYISPEFRAPLQIANELPVDTAVLKYSIGEDEGWLLLMTREGITAHKLPVKIKALPQMHRHQQPKLDELISFFQATPNKIGLNGLVELSRMQIENYDNENLEQRNLIFKIEQKSILEMLGSAVLPPSATKELRDKKTKRLLISADGVLHKIPFAILRLKDAETEDSQYFLEKYIISYVPSMAMLETIRQQKNERKLDRKKQRAEFLAFANPFFKPLSINTSFDNKNNRPNENLPLQVPNNGEGGLNIRSLPETEQEALQAASLFGSPQEHNQPIDNLPESATVVFNGSGADESQVKRLLEMSTDKAKKDWKYVLFGTHGIAFENQGMFSYLLFSTPPVGSKEDGFLQAQEILGFDMDTDLVMMAACETGLGTLSQGEGLLGLTTSFFIAGAESVVSSLWSVESRSTSQLVINLFNNLKTNKMDRAEALRLAQLKVMKDGETISGERMDYSSPFFWGAFILMGDYAPVKNQELLNEGIQLTQDGKNDADTTVFNPGGNSPSVKMGMRANSRNEVSGQRLAPTALETVRTAGVNPWESIKPVVIIITLISLLIAILLYSNFIRSRR